MKGPPLAKTAMVLLLLMLSAGARADLQTLSPREIWPEAAEAVRAGNLREATRTVDELLAAGRTLDIERFPVFAEAAASLALQAHSQNNKALADWAISTARRLDPNSPDVEFTSADLARKRSDWRGYFSATLVGAVKTFSNYRARILAVSDLGLALAAAIVMAGAIFALLLLYRYGKSAVHDFTELLSSRFSPATAPVVAWALLFAPLFLWFGPGWLLMYWFALFFAYAGWKERAIIVFLILAGGMLPVFLSWTSYRIAGIDSPVIQAAVAAKEKSFNPEASRRLRQMQEVLPDEPVIALLLGNLEVQEANERAAAQHFRRAVELNDKLAGAHLNLGNLYFFENDSRTARLEYEKAAELEPDMAIAYYNNSVASGETYEFAAQGRQLELAKQHDRFLVNELLRDPPRQKVVMYHLPLAEAWEVAERVARSGDAREIYGNHAVFDLSTALRNPLTAAAALALLAAVALWWLRRKNGPAGECIKCGRTYCYRCKAASESAKYCTQCIHIYLRRDGVSIETKREKVEEVQVYQTRNLRRSRIMTTFLPGSAQIINDVTLWGFFALLLFISLLSVAVFIGRLAPIAAPAEMMKTGIRLVAVVLAAIVWLAASIPVYRGKVVT